ncbi:hypothetical protein CHS0354_025036 [Potamilus streckersoni]|uniref:Uncharacterized protein n=1 Tax=Potamilus streckersoni TaxID=2493646 RepID=A0AAE0T9U6_9BIVA|nr:hypothetical protein CHS0354_025036 [Potamilus streckersoni]
MDDVNFIGIWVTKHTENGSINVKYSIHEAIAGSTVYVLHLFVPQNCYTTVLYDNQGRQLILCTSIHSRMTADFMHVPDSQERQLILSISIQSRPPDDTFGPNTIRIFTSPPLESAIVLSLVVLHPTS